MAGGNREGREGVWPGVESKLAGREVVDLYPENSENSEGFPAISIMATEKVHGCSPGNNVTGRLEPTEKDQRGGNPRGQR